MQSYIRYILALVFVTFVIYCLQSYEYVPDFNLVEVYNDYAADYSIVGIEGFPEWEVPMEDVHTPQKGSCRAVSFLVAVRCKPGDFWLRDTYRRTYGKFALEHNFFLIFAIGRTTNNTNQSLIDEEAKTYKDILQSNYIDSYKNITYKTVAILNYLVKQCNPDSVVLKVDDDVLWRVATVSSMVERFKHIREGIACKPLFHRGPVRGRSKWQVLPSEFNGTKYPPYCQGATFFVKHSVSRKILRQLPRSMFFWIDDVYITGFVREQIKEPLIDYARLMDISPGHVTNVKKTFEMFNKTYPRVIG